MISAENMSYIGNHVLPIAPPTQNKLMQKTFSGKWSFQLLITLATSLYWIVGLMFHYDMI